MYQASQPQMIDLIQYHRAIQDYVQAIRLDPNYAQAYFNRSWAYGYLSQDAEAAADKAKACSLDSKYYDCPR